MKKQTVIKRGDLWLTAGLLAVGLIAAILLPILLPTGASVSIERNGETLATYPLDTDRRVRLESEDGYNLLVIENGRAYIEDSDCRCGVCVAHSPISKEGESVICLPHKLIVRVVGEERDYE